MIQLFNPRPRVEVLAGELSNADLELVRAWIARQFESRLSAIWTGWS